MGGQFRSRLRIGLNGHLELGQTAMITARIVVATAVMGAAAWAVWAGLDHLLGRSLPAEIVSVGISLLVAGVLYARMVLVMAVSPVSGRDLRGDGTRFTRPASRAPDAPVTLFRDVPAGT